MEVLWNSICASYRHFPSLLNHYTIHHFRMFGGFFEKARDDCQGLRRTDSKYAIKNTSGQSKFCIYGTVLTGLPGCLKAKVKVAILSLSLRFSIKELKHWVDE